MNNYRFVVAIDYGTSASGYAWAIANSTGGDDGKLRNLSNINFSAGSSDSGGKDSSDLVTDSEGRLLTWDELYSNEQRLRNRIGSETLALNLKKNNLFQHKRVKMDLYDPDSNRREERNVIGNVDNPEEIYREISNVKFYTLDLIAAALRELSERALEEIRLAVGEECPPPRWEIQWIITLPANAKQAQKDAMREAARRAGIIDDRDAANLILACEPEAATASIYANDSVRLRYEKIFQKECIIFLVDAGGGTVDVSAYLCDLNKKTLKEAGNSQASNAGSTYVDQAIFAYILEEYFLSAGPDFWFNFQGEAPEDYQRFRKEVTKAKEGYQKGKASKLNVGGGDLLTRYCDEREPKIPYNREKFGKYNDICLPSETFENFIKEQFNKASDAIKDVAKQVVDTHPNVPICYTMVGGLSCSEVYRKLVEEYFEQLVAELSLEPEKVRRLDLNDNNNLRKRAVLNGAVLFGDDPTMFLRCFCKHTFGTEDLVPYDLKLHAGRKTRRYNDQLYLDDPGFTPFVKKGDKPIDGNIFHMRRWQVCPSKKLYPGETVNVEIPLWEIFDTEIPVFLKDTEKKKLVETYKFKITCDKKGEACYLLAFTADNTEMRIKAIDCSNGAVVLDKPARYSSKIWKYGV